VLRALTGLLAAASAFLPAVESDALLLHATAPPRRRTAEITVRAFLMAPMMEV
jgi:hypothetical protein